VKSEADGRFAAITLVPTDFDGNAVVTAVAGKTKVTKSVTIGAVDPVKPPSDDGDGSDDGSDDGDNENESPKPSQPNKPSQPTNPSTNKRGKLSSSKSGLPWASGMWIQGSATPAQFGSYRGSGVDVVSWFPPRETWADLSSFAGYTDGDYAVSVGIPLIPEGGANFGTCASGGYNGNWTTIANAYKAKGLDKPGKTVFRLSWEFNLNRSPKPGSADQFINCWRNVHKTVHAIAPNILFDWNPNRGPSQMGIPTGNMYPGDAYVDIIGIDNYDGYGDWNVQFNGNEGIMHWFNFAKSHGKTFSIPEWGPYTGTAWAGNNNGDNPSYITNVFNFLKANSQYIAYETQFNSDESYCGCALFPAAKNPKASAQYAQLW
jgi:hypothetical protein